MDESMRILPGRILASDDPAAPGGGPWGDDSRL